MKKRPTLFLIDSSSLIFRAFFAIRRLSTSKGLPTNAIYGFATMLLNVLEKQRPDYLACVFDTAAPTFRKEMYTEYKAHRGAPPDDLQPQFEHIHRLVSALGVAKLAEPGFEADDLIATLAGKFKDCDVVIVTGDKDLMQLVDARVKTLDTMNNKLYGPVEVKEKLGVRPEFVSDYLGLIGDSSDNIPGVPGVGPKTAAELIDEYGHLEDILKAIPRMKAGKRRDVLLEHAETARLSKKLATVRHDVGGHCAKVELEELRAPTPGGAAFLAFLREMEFHSLEKKYGHTAGTSVGGTATDAFPAEKESVVRATASSATPVASDRDWKHCLEKISHHDVIGFEIETAGEKTTETEVRALHLATASGETFRVDATRLEAAQVLEGLKKAAKGRVLAVHDLKTAYRAMLSAGIEMEDARFFDTMLAHYLIEPEEKHGLDVLCGRYLDSPSSGSTALDAQRLVAPLTKELRRFELEKLFHEIEMPVAPVLAHMEWIGVALDPKVLEALSEEFAKDLVGIEREIFKHTGSPFNLNSPKQLSEVLFGKLGLPTLEKTKTGFSTDVSVLQRLAPLHPVPDLIVRYRELTKLKSTYVDVLPQLIEKDGRVHARFNQAVTATGRLSGSDPNLQNIPIKSENGRRIRRAFVAPKGTKLVAADYSQIELRLVAHLSGDKALLRAFQEKQDVHRATAAEIFHVSPEDVTERQRGAAKAINFGLIYGKSAFGLAQELNIPRGEAQAYIDAYFVRYKGVKAFMDQCLEYARKNGEARTMFGRRRPIKDIDSKNAAVRGAAQRIAMNAPLQGAAADIMKIAMISAFRACRKLDARLILQVHDELVLEAPKTGAEAVRACLSSEMEGAARLSVPLEVNAGVAENWMEL